jgi:ABC-type multidrug transport system fused ATPase/permease subunit
LLTNIDLLDLRLLLASDMQGVNVSGGQKARIALARAVYADADVYLFDDCLSAVDAHVGRYLFDKCISGYLAQHGKTVLLVTHQLQFVPSAEHVVVLDHGKIVE